MRRRTKDDRLKFKQYYIYRITENPAVNWKFTKIKQLKSKNTFFITPSFILLDCGSKYCIRPRVVLGWGTLYYII